MQEQPAATVSVITKFLPSDSTQHHERTHTMTPSKTIRDPQADTC
jgi:hypothetical protein